MLVENSTKEAGEMAEGGLGGADKSEKSVWAELRDEKLKEYFEYLPDSGEYGVDDFRGLLGAAEKEQADKIRENPETNREEIRILGSVMMRLKKIIREFELPQENYRNVAPAKEKYSTKELLYKSFSL